MICPLIAFIAWVRNVQLLQLDSYITTPAASHIPHTHTIKINSARILLPVLTGWIISDVLYLQTPGLFLSHSRKWEMKTRTMLAKFRCSVTWRAACHCRAGCVNQWSVALSSLSLSHHLTSETLLYADDWTGYQITCIYGALMKSIAGKNQLRCPIYKSIFNEHTNMKSKVIEGLYCIHVGGTTLSCHFEIHQDNKRFV